MNGIPEKTSVALDIIGDVHGQADRLEALLIELGYRQRGGAWRHPERTAAFVGDLIDRGPGQVRTLRLVRDMVEAGTARVVMGNHELNAIAWATRDPQQPDRHLRSREGARGEANRRQHAAFLAEVGEDSAEQRAWIDWFLDLPLWIEEPGYRIVHACWHPGHVGRLKPLLRDGDRLDPGLVAAASRKGSDVHAAVETILKGQEIPLPAGHAFTDKDGHVRRNMRTRWWRPTHDTYRDAYIGPRWDEAPDLPVPDLERIPEADRPTFIGHYWFDPSGPVEPASDRVVCVDYSAGAGGPLAAYRFSGETALSAEAFRSVQGSQPPRETGLPAPVPPVA